MSAAALLGGVWYGAFALNPATRTHVIESGYWNFDLRAGEMVCLVVVVSVVMAMLFKRRIAKAQTLYQHAALALGLPLVGTVFFTWGLVGLAVLPGRGGLNSVSEIIWLLVLLPPVALTAPIVNFPVTLALGAASQAIMHRLAISGRNSPAKVG